MTTFDPSRRFWGFRSENYYPAGGLGDIAASFDDEATARAWLSFADDYGCRELLDTETRLMLDEGEIEWKPVSP